MVSTKKYIKLSNENMVRSKLFESSCACYRIFYARNEKKQTTSRLQISQVSLN